VDLDVPFLGGLLLMARVLCDTCICRASLVVCN
jgi:hypothetical protein